MEVLYRAQATASGGGREDGRSATDDGKIDVKLSTPKEMGGKGGDGQGFALMEIGVNVTDTPPKKDKKYPASTSSTAASC